MSEVGIVSIEGADTQGSDGFQIFKDVADAFVRGKLELCDVTVTWVSVTYVAGDIGNDWVLNASANGNNFPKENATINPGAVHPVGAVVKFAAPLPTWSFLELNDVTPPHRVWHERDRADPTPGTQARLHIQFYRVSRY